MKKTDYLIISVSKFSILEGDNETARYSFKTNLPNPGLKGMWVDNLSKEKIGHHLSIWFGKAEELKLTGCQMIFQPGGMVESQLPTADEPRIPTRRLCLTDDEEKTLFAIYHQTYLSVRLGR